MSKVILLTTLVFSVMFLSPNVVIGETITLNCEKTHYEQQPVELRGTKPGTILHPDRTEIKIDYSNKTLIKKELDLAEFQRRGGKKTRTEVFSIIENTKTGIIAIRLDPSSTSEVDQSRSITTIAIEKTTLVMVETYSSIVPKD